MLPARNRRDWEDIPEDARNKLEFIWLEKAEDAAVAGLETRPPPLSESGPDARSA
jgi:ATP-dependent Lon protease